MNPEQDNFEQLRRVLALKRHEQPPPGFFDNFPRNVLFRIRNGELGDEAGGIGRWFWQAPWLQSLWAALERKPAFAGALGLGVCGLLLTGFICSVAPADPASQNGAAASQSLAAIDVLPGAQRASVFVSSTNGIMPEPLQNSLFEQFRASQVQPTATRVSLTEPKGGWQDQTVWCNKPVGVAPVSTNAASPDLCRNLCRVCHASTKAATKVATKVWDRSPHVVFANCSNVQSSRAKIKVIPSPASIVSRSPLTVPAKSCAPPDEDMLSWYFPPWLVHLPSRF